MTTSILDLEDVLDRPLAVEEFNATAAAHYQAESEREKPELSLWARASLLLGPTVVCSWCEAEGRDGYMRGAPRAEGQPITHGICDPCAARMLQPIRAQKEVAP